MSEENVEIVRQLFEAIARRDSETVLALYHPDVEFDGTRHRWTEIADAPTVVRGHEGIREWSRWYYGAWEGIEDEIEEVIDAGDQVVTIVTTRARGRGSGIEVEWKQNIGVWRIRDGRITRVAWYRDRDEALRDAGISPA
jgi:ketosteroid isomerase-like protein